MADINTNLGMIASLWPDVEFSHEAQNIWRDQFRNKNQIWLEEAIKRTYAFYSTTVKLPWVLKFYYKICNEHGDQRKVDHEKQKRMEDEQSQLEHDQGMRAIVDEFTNLGSELRMEIAADFRKKHCPQPFPDPGDGDPLGWSEFMRGMCWAARMNEMNGPVRMTEDGLVSITEHKVDA